ncbi:uncharacterized protein LOC135840665 [Planococcus citri]|uniref:uncharacterized protein LOC135840665 n=1 Tax=Planococcus citri TaxID=170843 RepID=UPI0031FA2F6B
MAPGDAAKKAEALAQKRAEEKAKLETSKRSFVRYCEKEKGTISDLIEKTPSLTVATALEAHLESWNSALNDIASLDAQLLDYIEATDETLEAEEAKVCEFHDDMRLYYYDMVGKLKLIREKINTMGGSPRRSVQNISFSDSVRNPIVKLQDVPVPKFDGSFANFPDWYFEFSSIVDKNESFSDFEKLYLLKRAMGKGAETLLQDIGNDGNLYRATFKNLYDTYFNQRRIIAEHFANLVDMPSIKNSSIREAVEKVKRALRGLQVCGINIEEMSPLVAFLVSRKISEKLRTDWENSNHDYSVYPSFDSLARFLINRSFSYETSSAASNSSDASKSSTKDSGPKGKSSSVPEKKLSAAAKSSNGPSAPKCSVCDDNHYLNQCQVFKNKSVSDRFDFVKMNKLCLKCFNPYHNVFSCKRNNCTKCNGKHHTLLHREISQNFHDSSSGSGNGSSGSSVPPKPPEGEVKSVNMASGATVGYTHGTNKTVFLSTAVVEVKGKFGSELGRILIDLGSETTLITREFCTRAKLKIAKNDHPTILTGISNKSIELNSVTSCILRSRYSDFQISIDAEVIDKIPYKVSRNNVQEIIKNFPHNFAESSTLPYDDVDILLGSEYVEFVLAEKRYFVDGLCLRDSPFGYVISGALKSSLLAEKVSFCGLSNSELSAQFKRFVSIDEVSESENLLSEKIVEHRIFEEHFEKTYKVDEKTGRFVVCLPIKPSIVELNGSYERARSLLINNERRRSEKAQNEYCKIFAEYEEKGHMTRISSEPNPEAYFMPHHLVSKENSSRVVFNASFCDKSGTSLNDHLYQGPVLQPELSTNVNQFREHVIGVCADVARMYRCIIIAKEHRIYQHILFRYSCDEPILICELNTLTNGIGPASSIATKCVEKIGDSIEVEQPIAAESIKKHCYMDNWMSGAPTVEKAIELQKTVHSTFDRFGFSLRKYQSNSPEVLCSIDSSLIEPLKQKVLGDSSFIYVLGLIWSPEPDTLSVSVTLDKLPSKITKRVVLSEVSKLFDILGMLIPVTIRAKILLQDLWIEGKNWDDDISDKLKAEFMNYREQLPSLHAFSIPRCYCTSVNVVSRSLIGFCDASERAYCSVIYIRSIDNNGNIFVSFVCAKSRVAPIKSINTSNIHRLELLGAELLSKLIVRIGLELKIDRENFYLFSDSQVTLSWIKLDPIKLKQFVSNRIVKIVALTKRENWFYVETKLNPADCGTRGLSSNAFLSNSMWYEGPSWLTDNEVYDKYISTVSPMLNNVPEMKLDRTCMLVFAYLPIAYIVEKYYSLYKILSTIGYWLRYIRILKGLVDCKRNENSVVDISLDKNRKFLSAGERKQAMFVIIRFVQKEKFDVELQCLQNKVKFPRKSRLKALNVFLDDNGLMRVGGRLENSSLSYDTKHPIILPANCRFMERYVTFVHEKHAHALHIEIVEDLTTEAFLSVLERFVARRGLPRIVYSDNATNFIGTKNVLLNDPSINRFLGENGIDWRTIAPHSPHQGGLWESAVKAGKSYLIRSIGNQVLNLFELSSVAAKVESILNSRPLCYQRTNEFVAPISPGHFLIGADFSEVPVSEASLGNLKARYRLWRQVVDSFWVSWRQNYLNELQVRHKWQSKEKNFEVDDVVLVSDKNVPNLRWPMAIIEEVFPDSNVNLD